MKTRRNICFILIFTFLAVSMLTNYYVEVVEFSLIRLSLEYIKINGNLNEIASTDEKQNSSAIRNLEKSNNEIQEFIQLQNYLKNHFNLTKELQNSFQNIPVLSSMQMKGAKASKKQGCSIYPKIIDIKFSNTYWQLFKNQSSTLYLYGAYFGKISFQKYE